MNLYTIKIQQKYWSGKAQNMGAAIKVVPKTGIVNFGA